MLKRIILAGVIFIVLLMLVAGIQLGMTQAQDEGGYADNERLLADYGNEILDNQEKILAELKDIKEELRKVKIRVTR